MPANSRFLLKASTPLFGGSAGCQRNVSQKLSLILYLLIGLLPFPLKCSGLTNGLALTPPMGFNPWYHCTSECREWYVLACVDAMATNGMLAAGYNYINLDDCWFAGRDEQGRILEDRNRFPGGITNLSNYIHSKGFNFGLYLPAIPSVCNAVNTPGYETQDAATLLSYDTDFLKYDFINGRPGAVLALWNAIKAAGGNMVYSLSCGAYESWMTELGNSWRTSGDYYRSDWTNVIRVLNDNTRSAANAGPGHWNDPDFLHIGVTIAGGTMTEEEYRSHFSMWCMMASPLIVGTDVTRMPSSLLDILLSPELIAVDQDPAGVQGVPVESSPGTGGNVEVWCKPLGFDGFTKAVALFNRSDLGTNITAHWENLGLPSGPATVRDLWGKRDLGLFSGAFTTNVPSHATVVLKIVSVPQPALQVLSAGRDIVFAWPLSASNYVLETSTSPSPSTLWTPVTNDPVVVGDALLVTNRVTEPSAFYRLRGP